MFGHKAVELIPSGPWQAMHVADLALPASIEPSTRLSAWAWDTASNTTIGSQKLAFRVFIFL